MLRIKNLSVQAEEKKVLKDLELHVQSGETHVIMGPNGSGKSSLSKFLIGDPSYNLVSGSVEYEVNLEYKNLLEMSVDTRAKEGLFLAFQNPIEIPGVKNIDFLRMAFNSITKFQGGEPMEEEAFYDFIKAKVHKIELPLAFLQRPVNIGFSGGEKKRNEILQMLVLSPRLTVLDEIDSGMDIDALKILSKVLQEYKNEKKSLILITHYQQLLKYIQPDFLHIMIGGKIVKTGDLSLLNALDQKGYRAFLN